jgi:4-diphosphocytidyl-2-C-methyl-D-erythritol kinase
MSGQVTVSAPAKINLHLGVGPVRADGYHPLATVYQAVALFDEVSVRPAPAPSLTVHGDGVDVSAVPTDSGNLALRAARALARHHRLDEDVHVHLHKRIPVAGGLAGGSTDAAAALLACDTLWELGTPLPDLLALAATLGSDVPFCLLGGTAIGAGRGELVTPVAASGSYWWVIVPADGGLSTPAVYAEFDRLTIGAQASAPEIPGELLAALGAGDVEGLAATVANDLQPAALSMRPDLGALLRRGIEASARASLVSGSGPTTLHLCADRDHAVAVSHAFEPPGIVAEAPAHGARVVEHEVGV